MPARRQGKESAPGRTRRRPPREREVLAPLRIVPGTAPPRPPRTDRSTRRPSVRRMARETGGGSGEGEGDGAEGAVDEGGRREGAGRRDEKGGGLPFEIAPWPEIEFEKYGPVDRVPLSRIKRISGPNLARNWVTIPHVTHNDEADITDLEAFRKQINSEQDDVKVTMVALLVKACVSALKKFPDFNSSLAGDELVLKRYYHIGFAADTPQGLLVPVIRDADSKGLLEIAGDLRELSGKARELKLSAEEMKGSTFTISSLGGNRRHLVHADRQRARGRDPRRHPGGDAPDLGRLRVRPPTDLPALALLRPPRHRRRRGREIHRVPRHRARRLPEGSPLMDVPVPDIGDFDEVPVIEIHVKAGDTVSKEDPLVTLESDKATMDVPAPAAGTVDEVLVSINDKVSEGTPILRLSPSDADADEAGGGEAPAAHEENPPPESTEDSTDDTRRIAPTGRLPARRPRRASG